MESLKTKFSSSFAFSLADDRRAEEGKDKQIKFPFMWLDPKGALTGFDLLIHFGIYSNRSRSLRRIVTQEVLFPRSLKKAKIVKSFFCEKVKWFARKWKVFLLAVVDGVGGSEWMRERENKRQKRRNFFVHFYFWGSTSTSLSSHTQQNASLSYSFHLRIGEIGGDRWKYKPWPFGEIFLSDIIESLFSTGILSAKT